MSIKHPSELRGVMEIGKIVGNALFELRKYILPGLTTREINTVCKQLLKKYKAYAAPPIIYGFPGSVCLSVNDEIVHGVPSDRILLPGDVVKLDLVAEKNGYFADAAITVGIEPVPFKTKLLIQCAEHAFDKALSVAQAGIHINEIGKVVEMEVEANGFSVVKELTGHGVGRNIHEKPVVPNYYQRNYSEKLTRNLVITIEPIITEGASKTINSEDGWTIKTMDGSNAAHFEHTVIITDDTPIIVTKAA